MPEPTTTDTCEACHKPVAPEASVPDAGGGILCPECAAKEPIYVGVGIKCGACGFADRRALEFTGRKEQRWPPYWLSRGKCPACERYAVLFLSRIPYTTDLELIERPEGEPEFDGVRFQCLSNTCGHIEEGAVEHRPGPEPSSPAWFARRRCPACKYHRAVVDWIPYVEGMKMLESPTEVLDAGEPPSDAHLLAELERVLDELGAPSTDAMVFDNSGEGILAQRLRKLVGGMSTAVPAPPPPRAPRPPTREDLRRLRTAVDRMDRPVTRLASAIERACRLLSEPGRTFDIEKFREEFNRDVSGPPFSAAEQDQEKYRKEFDSMQEAAGSFRREAEAAQLGLGLREKEIQDLHHEIDAGVRKLTGAEGLGFPVGTLVETAEHWKAKADALAERYEAPGICGYTRPPYREKCKHIVLAETAREEVNHAHGCLREVLERVGWYTSEQYRVIWCRACGRGKGVEHMPDCPVGKAEQLLAACPDAAPYLARAEAAESDMRAAEAKADEAVGLLQRLLDTVPWYTKTTSGRNEMCHACMKPASDDHAPMCCLQSASNFVNAYMLDEKKEPTS